MIRATHAAHTQRTQSKPYQEVVRVIAANVLAKRELAGLTQLQLAEAIGGKQPAIARLERCHRSDRHATIELGFLTDIASAMGVDVHSFFIAGYYKRPAKADASKPGPKRKSFDARARASVK